MFQQYSLFCRSSCFTERSLFLCDHRSMCQKSIPVDLVDSNTLFTPTTRGLERFVFRESAGPRSAATQSAETEVCCTHTGPLRGICQSVCLQTSIENARG